MNTMTFERPFVGEPLLAPTLHRVKERGKALIRATGARTDPHAALGNPVLAECLVAPDAGFAVALTCCNRPLVFPEGEFISQASGYDMVLLRFDPIRGTSFDILFNGGRIWFCHHLAWRRRDGDLWFIPSATAGPFIRACNFGLVPEEAPPFDGIGERYAGIIRAIDNPSFEGRL